MEIAKTDHRHLQPADVKNGAGIAVHVLRGLDWASIQLTPVLDLCCLDCLDGPAAETSSGGELDEDDDSGGSGGHPGDDEWEYESTISFAVDKLHLSNLDRVKQTTSQLPPVAYRPRKLSMVTDDLICKLFF